MDHTIFYFFIFERLSFFYRIVFEDATFSYDRLKLSFITALNSLASLISKVDHSSVRIPLCIL